MNIAIAGGTGFVGSALTKYLLAQNHHVYILTRNILTKENRSNVTYVEWLTPKSQPEHHLKDIDALINLAGETINGRWTKKKKTAILNSRLLATHEIFRLLTHLNKKPSVYINASAIGIYGTSGIERFTERSKTNGHDFLATVVKRWENEAAKIKELEIRTVFARFGVILGREEGALPRIVLPYRFYAGGRIGSGKQWVSWIHIDDAVRMLDWALSNSEIAGPINVTAPKPVQMNQFGQEISTVIHRPHWLIVPSFPLKMLLGEMSMLILKGQHVYPEKAMQLGFDFSYPRLHHALQDLLTGEKNENITNRSENLSDHFTDSQKR